MPYLALEFHYPADLLPTLRQQRDDQDAVFLPDGKVRAQDLAVLAHQPVQPLQEPLLQQGAGGLGVQSHRLGGIAPIALDPEDQGLSLIHI